MTAFYSPSAKGFFDTKFHSSEQIPADAVAITGTQHRELIAGVSQGLVVQIAAGSFELVEPPVDPAAVARAERAWRDEALASMIALRDRHRDQVEIGSSTTLTTEQFGELLVYMQALRDWPQSDGFPVIDNRPVAPGWLSDATL